MFPPRLATPPPDEERGPVCEPAGAFLLELVAKSHVRGLPDSFIPCTTDTALSQSSEDFKSKCP